MKKRNPYIVEGTIKNGTVRYKSHRPKVKSTTQNWIENIFCTALFFAVVGLWIYIFYGLGFFEAL